MFSMAVVEMAYGGQDVEAFYVPSVLIVTVQVDAAGSNSAVLRGQDAG